MSDRISDRIDLHIHNGSADMFKIFTALDRFTKSNAEFQVSVHRKLDDILTHVANITGQGRDLMATVQDLQQFVVDLDEETNGIATRLDRNTATIDTLKKQIADGSPVSQEQLDMLANGFKPISDRLRALGSDPVNPIPPIEPPL